MPSPAKMMWKASDDAIWSRAASKSSTARLLFPGRGTCWAPAHGAARRRNKDAIPPGPPNRS